MKISKPLLATILFALFVAGGIVFILETRSQTPLYNIEQNLYSVQGVDSVITQVRYISKPGYTIGSRVIFEAKSKMEDAQVAYEIANEFVDRHKLFNKNSNK